MTPEIKNLTSALEFYDKVLAAESDEKIAVGTDHYDWLIDAARKVVESSKADSTT